MYDLSCRYIRIGISIKSSTLSFLNVSKSKLSDSVESLKDKAFTPKTPENSKIDDSLVISWMNLILKSEIEVESLDEHFIQLLIFTSNNITPELVKSLVF